MRRAWRAESEMWQRSNAALWPNQGRRGRWELTDRNAGGVAQSPNPLDESTDYLFFAGFFAADGGPFAFGVAGCSLCSGSFETVRICS